MTKNVFVAAPEAIHWATLQSVAGVGDWLHLHSLLSAEDVVHVTRLDVDAVLDEARAQLDAFPDGVDGIITQWDFPMSIMVPILCHERGLRSPSLESVVRCSHKYWSRVSQRDVIREMTPRFQLVDPFSPTAARDLELAFPFWMKPVIGFSSNLGFAIHDRREFEAAIERTRAEIRRLAEPYDRLLRIAGVPDELRVVGGVYCIAEELLVGQQVAHEGFVLDGEVAFHGTLDMERERNAFTQFIWPSQKPDSVIARMEDATAALLERIGFDDGCFNAEYLCDPETDRLSFIEVNPRISQSHSPMCMWVDGRSNHEVAIDVALGMEPLYDPGSGDYQVAAKFMELMDDDGRVTRLPTPDEVDALQERFAPTFIDLLVKSGEKLSELIDQDAYRYCYADVYMAAQDRESLFRKHDELMRSLKVEVKAA